jgi:thiamine biosynthesis lipoprotein
MKKAAVIIMLFSMLLSFYACSGNMNDTETRTSYAMGSMVTQTIYGGDKQVLENAINAIGELDSTISYRNDNSEIAALNSNGNATLSEKTLELINQSVKLSSETDGKYDITVLPLVLLWGFDGDTPSLPSDSDITPLLKKVGNENIEIDGNKVSLHNGVTVDLSAAGKGEACEVALNEYKKSGVTGGIVTVGGSVGVCGTKNGEKFTIGVRDPFDTSSLLGTIKITDTYISTSGSYEKKFTSGGVTYHHILDPDTGYPADSGLVSVTVVCPDGGLSDILATAFFCIGMDKAMTLMDEYSAEAVFVTADKKVYITEGLKNIFNSSYDFTVITP